MLYLKNPLEFISAGRGSKKRRGAHFFPLPKSGAYWRGGGGLKEKGVHTTAASVVISARDWPRHSETPG